MTAFHLDLDFAPLSFDKRPATRDPRYWVTGALGAAAAATTANAVRRHRQYAPLRARGRALAAAAAADARRRRHMPRKGAGVSSTTVTELWRMSATELAEAIRSGQASSREVVEAHLRRIEQVNPAVNAIPVVLGEQALEAAREADRAAAGRSAHNPAPAPDRFRPPQPPGPVRPARR